MTIPEDLSLIAFHDADWTSVTSPPISVIAQPVYEMGVESARALVRRITGSGGAPKSCVLPTAYLSRQSVGPPPATRRARGPAKLSKV